MAPTSGSLALFDSKQLEEELARRKRKHPDTASGGTPPPHKRRKDEPIYKAQVRSLEDGTAIKLMSSASDVDKSILERIKKCLSTANHPNTPEQEAHAAILLATRLMSRYNVTQAEVLAHEPPETQKQ